MPIPGHVDEEQHDDDDDDVSILHNTPVTKIFNPSLDFPLSMTLSGTLGTS